MLDPLKHRQSARTTDPAVFAAKVAAIRQRLNHSKRRRYEQLTRPINPAEAFAHTEAQLEAERDRHT